MAYTPPTSPVNLLFTPTRPTAYTPDVSPVNLWFGDAIDAPIQTGQGSTSDAVCQITSVQTIITGQGSETSDVVVAVSTDATTTTGQGSETSDAVANNGAASDSTVATGQGSVTTDAIVSEAWNSTVTSGQGSEHSFARMKAYLGAGGLYGPPAGDAVLLLFKGAYTPPTVDPEDPLTLYFGLDFGFYAQTGQGSQSSAAVCDFAPVVSTVETAQGADTSDVACIGSDSIETGQGSETSDAVAAQHNGATVSTGQGTETSAAVGTTPFVATVTTRQASETSAVVGSVPKNCTIATKQGKNSTSSTCDVTPLYITPQSIDATTHGTQEIHNYVQYVNCSGLDSTEWGDAEAVGPRSSLFQGWDSMLFGQAAVQHYTRSLSARGFKDSNFGFPNISFNPKRVYPEGIGGFIGEPFVGFPPFDVVWQDPYGIDSLEFGDAYIDNYAPYTKRVFPKSILDALQPTQFGRPRLEPHCVYPNSIYGTLFSEAFVSNWIRYVSLDYNYERLLDGNGIDATRWGTAWVSHSPRYITPDGVDDEIVWYEFGPIGEDGKPSRVYNVLPTENANPEIPDNQYINPVGIDTDGFDDCCSCPRSQVGDHTVSHVV